MPRIFLRPALTMVSARPVVVLLAILLTMLPLLADQVQGAGATIPMRLDWGSPKAPIPTSRGILGLAAASNGKLYAAGGNGVGDLDTLESYDPSTNTWAHQAPMPITGGTLASLSDGKLYAVGGPGPTPSCGCTALAGC